MNDISDVKIGPLSESKYIQPFRVTYTQNKKQQIWDCIRQHDSIAVLIYNKTRDTLILVKQFRPAVFMSSNKPVWENSEIFKGNSLKMKSSVESKDEECSVQPQYGPGSEGITYELCAGIVDKPVSLEQIAHEEILEETGYNVPVENLRFVNGFWSNIGTAGSHQSLYYCEVTDDMMTTAGGGNPIEGELIDVYHLPLKEALGFLFDTSKKKSAGLCFGFMWFSQFVKPLK